MKAYGRTQNSTERMSCLGFDDDRVHEEGCHLVFVLHPECDPSGRTAYHLMRKLTSGSDEDTMEAYLALTQARLPRQILNVL